MGTYTSNNLFYKPAIGASGTVEKSKFDVSLDTADAYMINLNSTLASLNTLISNWVIEDDIVTLIPVAPTYSDNNTFTVPGDYTSRLTANKIVQVQVAAGMVYSTIASSSFGGGVTTVNLNDTVLTNPITRVYVVATRDGLWPNGPGYVVARDYGVPGTTAFNAALSFIGSTNRTLVLTPGAWGKPTGTIPANVNLKIERGATISLGVGETLTYNGSLDAGLYPIFTCTGTGKVDFTASTKIKEVYPQWFGATGDGATDDTLAVAKAVASVETSDIPVFFPKGSYLLTRQSSFVDEWDAANVYYAIMSTGKIRIKSDGATIKVSATDAAHTTGFVVKGTNGARIDGSSFSGLHFLGVGAVTTFELFTGPVILLTHCKNSFISDITIDGTKSGISVRYSENCHLSNIQRWVPISGGVNTMPLYHTHIGIYASSRCSLRDSSFWGGTGDGDILVFGSYAEPDSGDIMSISNVSVFNYAKNDPTKTMMCDGCIGIASDGGSRNVRISDCYAYGYAYGFSAQTYMGDTIITGCTAEKCWIGIYVWEGAAPKGVHLNTVVANNIVHPDGGNGIAILWSSTFKSIGICVDNVYGVTIDGNYIGNTLEISDEFTGIVARFLTAGVTDYHQAGANITNNRINMNNAVAGYNSFSKDWAMFFMGDSTNLDRYFHGVNVVGNLIKVNGAIDSNVSTQTVVQGYFLNNFKFCDNMFEGFFGADLPVLSLGWCTMVNVSGNNFPWRAWGDVISLTSIDGALVSGNMFGGYGAAAGASRYGILATDVKDLQVVGNQKYYAIQSAENQFVKGTGLDHVMITNNKVNMGWYHSTNFLSLSGQQIAAATKANPAVFTWASHGKKTGDKISFIGITQSGWTALNGNEYTIVEGIDDHTFSIKTLAGVAVDSSGYALAYDTGDIGTYWFQEIAHNQVTKRLK